MESPERRRLDPAWGMRCVGGSIVVTLLLAGACASPGEPDPGPRAGETREQAVPGSAASLTLAFVPGGSFLLGTPEGVQGREPDEGPRRRVSVDPFWIGVHEVTSDAYRPFREMGAATGAAEREGLDAITGPTRPYEDPMHGMGGGDRPAAGMTQWAALQYARWLSFETGRLYRLPTEAEWEYACRAGAAHLSGEAGVADAARLSGGATRLEDQAWFEANAGGRTHPVGLKAPNAWGLHDMLGNVAEWTLDEYRADFYASLQDGATNPLARPDGPHPRTVRGGSFEDPAAEVRCGARRESTLRWKRRDPQLPQSRWWNTDSPHVGFRLVSPAREHTPDEIRAYWRQHGGEGG